MLSRTWSSGGLETVGSVQNRQKGFVVDWKYPSDDQ